MTDNDGSKKKGRALGAVAAAVAAGAAAVGRKKLDDRSAEQTDELRAEAGLDGSEQTPAATGAAGVQEGASADGTNPVVADDHSGAGTTPPGDPVAEAEAAKHREGIQAWLPSVKVTVAAFLLAFVVGAIMIALSDARSSRSLGYFFTYPWDFFRFAGQAIWDSYSALVTGAFGGWTAITDTLEQSAPLICAGLGISLAFRAGMFNIGAQGQLLIGAVFAGYVGFTWDLPVVVHLVVALIAGLLGGALWGGIVGVLKARTGAHEVILTIMMNYIAMRLLDYLLTTNSFQRAGSENPRSPVVDGTARFPDLLGMHTGIWLAFLAAAAVWWLLERSTVGFELRAVGANPEASRTAGINVSRAYVVGMALAGLLAGLAGSQQVLGHGDPLAGDFSPSVGFDAITVALLGRATPLGTVLAGILFGAMTTGGTAMQASAAATPLSLTQLVQALIVLFVAAPALVKVIFRMKDVDDSGTLLAKGWS